MNTDIIHQIVKLCAELEQSLEKAGWKYIDRDEKPNLKNEYLVSFPDGSKKVCYYQKKDNTWLVTDEFIDMPAKGTYFMAIPEILKAS
jgi:hypothetical protein